MQLGDREKHYDGAGCNTETSKHDVNGHNRQEDWSAEGISIPRMVVVASVICNCARASRRVVDEKTTPRNRRRGAEVGLVYKRLVDFAFDEFAWAVYQHGGVGGRLRVFLIRPRLARRGDGVLQFGDRLGAGERLLADEERWRRVDAERASEIVRLL